jgi:enamine deaminase RidA (YjgF/YER057c/UK114 family)
MFFKNKFDLQIAPKTTRTFITNHPFRMALVTYAGRLKFMLYPSSKCALCERSADSTKQLVSAKHLVDVALEKYGASMSTIMKLECMSRGFKRAVSKKYYCAHQDFYALMGKYSVSWEDLAKELENRSSYPKRTWNREKNIANTRNSPPKEQVEFIDAVISGNLKQNPSKNIVMDED